MRNPPSHVIHVVHKREGHNNGNVEITPSIDIVEHFLKPPHIVLEPNNEKFNRSMHCDCYANPQNVETR